MSDDPVQANTVTAQRTLALLSRVTETEAATTDPELRLFDLGILDSLKTVELIVALSDEFGIEISPAEFDREEWATPSMIIANVSSRLAE